MICLVLIDLVIHLNLIVTEDNMKNKGPMIKHQKPIIENHKMPQKVTKELMEEIELLASRGLNKAQMIKLLPIGKTTFYKYHNLAQEYEGKEFTQKEWKELDKTTQRAIEMMNHFNKGQKRYLKRELTYFSESKDPKIRWRLFEKVFKDYRETMRYDFEQLDIDLRKILEPEHAEFVLRAVTDEAYYYKQKDLAFENEQLRKQVEELTDAKEE